MWRNTYHMVLFVKLCHILFAELKKTLQLQAKLVAAAGDMPILGPNCYGVINYLDGALLWPDQHGGQFVLQSFCVNAEEGGGDRGDEGGVGHGTDGTDILHQLDVR